MKKERSFILYLATDHFRFRNIFRKINGILSYVVQLEIELQSGKWKAVVRNDCEHGFCHRDLMYSDGRKKKEEVVIEKKAAIIIAIDDLKENFENYLKELGYNNFLERLPTLNIENDLEQAKQYLMNLFKHPEQIDSIGNEVKLHLRNGIALQNKVTVIHADKEGRIIEKRETQ